jgi:hypothetical protein
VTPGNVHDSQELPNLLHGDETRLYGDSAYRCFGYLEGEYSSTTLILDTAQPISSASNFSNLVRKFFKPCAVFHRLNDIDHLRRQYGSSSYE